MYDKRVGSKKHVTVWALRVFDKPVSAYSSSSVSTAAEHSKVRHMIDVAS